MIQKSPDPDSKLHFQGVHVDLSPALQETIRNKFSGLIRQNDRIVRVNVRLVKDQQLGHQNHYTATGQIEIAGPDLIAHVAGMDAYAALDGLADKLEHLLHDRQGRRQEKRHHPKGTGLGSESPEGETV